MGHPLTVELREETYNALERRAQATAQSPAELAAAALEQHFGLADSLRPVAKATAQAARLLFERHFGAVNLGHATGTDNEGIDADLAHAYANDHKGS